MSYLREHLSSALLFACAVTITLVATTPVFADNNNWNGGNALYVSKAGPTTGCPSKYHEIQEAVIAAKPGDTIFVCPGTYVVPVNITKPLQIIGIPTGIGSPAGSDLALLQPTTKQMTTNRATGEPIYPMLWFHDVSSGDIDISNLTVDGSNFGPCPASPCQEVGVLGQNARGDLKSMAVRFINLAGGPKDDGFGIFVQSGPGQQTRLNVELNTVHDYLSGGIIANEVGTRADIEGNSAHGLGEMAIVPQSGIQIGFGAAGNMEENLSTFHLGPAPHCQGSASSVNFAVQELPDPTIVVENNISSMAEIGIGDVNDRVNIEQNVVSDSLCAGIFVNDNNNHVNQNIIAHTCNPAQGPCSAPGNTATAIFVVGGTNNDVSGNTINEAAYGVASNSPTTTANNEKMSSVSVPFAGVFKSFSLAMRR